MTNSFLGILVYDHKCLNQVSMANVAVQDRLAMARVFNKNNEGY